MIFTIIIVVSIINVASAALDPDCSTSIGNPQNCCQITKLEIWNRESVEKCANSFADNSTGGPLDLYSKSIRGLSNCLCEEIGVIKDGKLQTNAINKLAEDIAKKCPKEWAQVITDAATYCTSHATDNPNPTDIADVEKYSPLGATFLGCIHTQFIKDCPAYAWKESDECNKTKQNSGKCLVSI